MPWVETKWTSWTPTVTQSGAVTCTVTFARYQIVGEIVHLRVQLDITGTGTTANAITIGGIPAAATPVITTGSDLAPLGMAVVLDQGTASYLGFLVASTATVWHIRDSNTRANIGVSPSFALANTDIIIFNATYSKA